MIGREVRCAHLRISLRICIANERNNNFFYMLQYYFLNRSTFDKFVSKIMHKRIDIYGKHSTFHSLELLKQSDDKAISFEAAIVRGLRHCSPATMDSSIR